MNIAKIIKIYFVFILTISLTGLVGYNTPVKNYVASVMHSIDGIENVSIDVNYGVLTPKKEEAVKKYNEGVDFNLKFISSDDPFAEPGSEKAAIMKFIFDSEEKYSIESLKLKISGVESKYILKAFLYDGEKEISEGKVDGGYIIFNGLDFAGKEFSILLDLSPEIKTSYRIRLDIEHPEDLKIEIDNKNYQVNDIYPIRGEYLTIVKKRNWGKYKKLQANKISALN